MYAGMYYGEVGFGQLPVFLLLISIIVANETESIVLESQDMKAIMQVDDKKAIMKLVSV